MKLPKLLLNCLRTLFKFIFGWIAWVIVFILSIVFSTITWNWKETLAMDMEIIISEICGKSTWETMNLNN
jgi:hypothetical protein